MASQLKQLVPYLLLLSIVSISHAKEKPCECSDSDQDRRSNHTFEDNDLTFRLIDKEFGVVRSVGFSFVRGLSNSAYAYNTSVLSTMYSWEQLWRMPDRSRRVDEASFSATIVYQPQPNNDPTMAAVYGGLVFLIIPFGILENLDHANNSLAEQPVASDVGSLNLNTTYRAVTSATENYEVSVAIGLLSDSTSMGRYHGERVLAVDISIQPSDLAAAAATNYSVCVDYDHVTRGLAVYVEVEGKPKPKNAIAEQSLNVSSVSAPYVYFSLVSTPAQLLRTSRGIDFGGTVDDLPTHYLPDKGGFLTRKMTILFSILVPVSATAVMTLALACYFNSRYRRWHRELDKLARSMERLPGVPTKVDFADINKATCNFRQTMKLGGGGFGTVYRCTLPAAASKMDQPMDVAVKRFTRDFQCQCC